MAIPFLSDAWAVAFKDAVNSSAAYKAAATTWEGDFYFIVDLAAGGHRDHGAGQLERDIGERGPQLVLRGHGPGYNILEQVG